MFEFQQLSVYQKAKSFNKLIGEYLSSFNPSRIARDQLSRAAFSVVLNIAEGSGRFSQADRRHFFIIARGSVFECVAALDVLNDENSISNFKELLERADELSRILYAMISNLK